MTVETKTTLMLDDLRTIEFECKSCHAVMTYQVGNFRTPPIACGCHQQKQWMTHGGDLYATIAHMAELMNRLAQLKDEHFVMRFGLKATSVSDRASNAEG